MLNELLSLHFYHKSTGVAPALFSILVTFVVKKVAFSSDRASNMYICAEHQRAHFYGTDVFHLIISQSRTNLAVQVLALINDVINH